MSNDQWLRPYLRHARLTECTESRFAAIANGIEQGAIGSREFRRQKERLRKRKERFEKKSIAWLAAQEAKRKAGK